jgi:hypothetical protein
MLEMWGMHEGLGSDTQVGHIEMPENASKHSINMEISAYHCMKKLFSEEEAMQIYNSSKYYKVCWIETPEGYGLITNGVNSNGWIEIVSVNLR